jgi:hypothetical protein
MAFKASTFLGIGEIPSVEIAYPKYSNLFTPKNDLRAFTFNPAD